MRAAASSALVVACVGLSASSAQTQAQLPPGFYSFAPSKPDLTAPSISRNAQGDLSDAIAAYRAQDFKSAFSMLKRPAKEGSIQANWLLATMYLRGQGVAGNLAAAYRHFGRIAEDYVSQGTEVSGNERYFVFDSLARMADSLRVGNEKAAIEKNVSRALHYYQTAASAGHAGAQFGFGLMYLRGEGVAIDRSYGMRWLGTAAQKRYAPAASILGDMYLDAGDVVRAIVWYRVAADTADKKLAAYVVEKQETLLPQLDDNETIRADDMYVRWTRKYPLQAVHSSN